MNIVVLLGLITIVTTLISITLVAINSNLKKSYINYVYRFFMVASAILFLITFPMSMSIKTSSEMQSEYHYYVTLSEEFDLACSNQETITFDLKRKMYNEAESLNNDIRKAKLHKGKMDEIFYNKLYFDAPEIILGKLK